MVENEVQRYRSSQNRVVYVGFTIALTGTKHAFMRSQALQTSYGAGVNN
jgi:hypothetical protein